jgi:rsbT co-antagonist protein RsbR
MMDTKRNDAGAAALNDVLQQDEAGILQTWLDQQVSSPGFRADRLNRAELNDQSRRFLSSVRDALGRGEQDPYGPTWKQVRDFLQELSTARAQQGFTASETATFIFSLKTALFERLCSRYGSQPELNTAAMLHGTNLLDRLGLMTTEMYQRGREQVIVRQQQELLELSTPVVTLWDGVLALPIIGTLDSARTQVVMENLLQRIVDSGASIAIIDITGVPTVDTLTAQHLLKTVAAARLMGADCIISGIRPQIAQTIVHLGVDLGNVVTKATLMDAFAIALQRLGLTIAKQDGNGR